MDLLRDNGAQHIQGFGGGGGVIIAREIQALQDYGVARIYSPQDGMEYGLQGMIDDIISRTRSAAKTAHGISKLARVHGLRA